MRYVVLCLLLSLTAACDSGATCTTDDDCFRGEACVREGEQKVCVKRAEDMGQDAPADQDTLEMAFDMDMGAPDLPDGLDMDAPDLPVAATLEACLASGCAQRGGVCVEQRVGVACIGRQEFERCAAAHPIEGLSPRHAVVGAALRKNTSTALIAGADQRDATALRVVRATLGGASAPHATLSGSGEVHVADALVVVDSPEGDDRVLIAARRQQANRTDLSVVWVNPNSGADAIWEQAPQVPQSVMIDDPGCGQGGVSFMRSARLCDGVAVSMKAAPARMDGSPSPEAVVAACLSDGTREVNALWALRPSADGLSPAWSAPDALCDLTPRQLSTTDADANQELGNVLQGASGHLWTLGVEAGVAQAVRHIWRGSRAQEPISAALIDLPEPVLLDDYAAQVRAQCGLPNSGLDFDPTQGMVVAHPTLRDEVVYLGELEGRLVAARVNIGADRVTARCAGELVGARWLGAAARASSWLAVARREDGSLWLVRGDWSGEGLALQRLGTGWALGSLFAHADGQASVLVREGGTLLWVPLGTSGAPLCD